MTFGVPWSPGELGPNSTLKSKAIRQGATRLSNQKLSPLPCKTCDNGEKRRTTSSTISNASATSTGPYHCPKNGRNDLFRKVKSQIEPAQGVNARIQHLRTNLHVGRAS